MSDAAAAYIAEAVKPACSDADKWATSELGQVATFRRGVSYDSSTLAESPAGARAYLNMKSFLKNGGYNYSGLKYFSGNVSADDLLDGNCVLIANTDVTREGDIIGAPITLPLALAGLEVVCSHHVTALRLQPQCDAQFIFYLLCLPRYRAVMRQHARGTTVLMLDPRSIEHIQFEHPESVAEQKKVAEVLDTLDTTIRQVKAIIAKLKQVKQGLLHDLLTRGIGANGELRPPRSEAPQLYKPSSLGWIPKEWDAHQLRDLATLITSGSRGWAAHYVDAGALFVRSQNVRMGFLDFSDRQHVAPPPGSEGQRTRLEGCDLLITITGNSVGNVAHVSENWQEIAFVSQHVGLVRLRDPSLSLLAAHYLVQGAPGNQQLIDAQYGQSKPGLNLENLRDLRVPCPSTEERTAVVERIASVDMRIETEERYLSKLSEFKQGLMDDLLTGRVRVTPLLEATATPMAQMAVFRGGKP